MSSSTIAVFLGPSLPLDEARAILPAATFFAPAQAGDVYRAYAFSGARTIVLIDGVFGPVPSVWHKEILGALESGVFVVGAASMGALRAAECQSFGMIGHGWVFDQYANGLIEGDDEVALLHLGAEDDHHPISVPMVRLRYAVGAAVARDDLTYDEGTHLLEVAHRVHYADRTWERLAALSSSSAPARRFLEKLRSSGDDIKAEDARAALRLVASGTVDPPTDPIAVEDTAFWQRLREEAVEATGGIGRPPVPQAIDTETLEAVLLDSTDPRTGLEARVSAHLVAMMAAQLGLAPTSAEVAAHADTLRRRRGLTSRAAMSQWMQEHDVSVRAWSAAVRHDLLVDRLEDEFAGELRRYAALVNARGFAPPPESPRSRSHAEDGSIHGLLQPLAEGSGFPVVATYDELARRLGFVGVTALVEAVQRVDARSTAL